MTQQQRLTDSSRDSLTAAETHLSAPTGRLEVQEVLAENQDLIDAVFGYYHDLDLEDGRCKLSSNRPELSLDGFIRLAKELGLCAHVASHQELCVLFRLCRDESECLDGLPARSCRFTAVCLHLVHWDCHVRLLHCDCLPAIAAL